MNTTRPGPSKATTNHKKPAGQAESGHVPIPQPWTDEAESGHVQILPVASIRPSPENNDFYHPVNRRSAAFRELVASVKARGILEPVVVSADRYIISGHRRHAAAQTARLNTIPCRVRADVNRVQDSGKFLTLLREHNLQRVKTVDEVAREEVAAAAVNPEEAYQALIEHRADKSAVPADKMELGAARGRAAISPAKIPMLEAIANVLQERRAFWPLSDRQIHYALLSRPEGAPLIHASKPASTYQNDKASYKALTDLLTRARLVGRIPFAAIADETRPAMNWSTHQNVGEFLRVELDNVLRGYWRNLLQSQLNHVELIVEKNTVLPILRPIAQQYTMAITSGRGYCSLPPRHAIAQRFKASGRERLVLLVVSDFDPDGEQIAQSFGRSMRDDFGIDAVELVKVALTGEQVKTFRLPPSMKAKAGCTTRKAFVAAHGENVFEVEALAPEQLQKIVRDAIDRVLDIKSFNAELSQEKADAGELEKLRRRVLAAIGPAIHANGEAR